MASDTIEYLLKLRDEVSAALQRAAGAAEQAAAGMKVAKDELVAMQAAAKAGLRLEDLAAAGNPIEQLAISLRRTKLEIQELEAVTGNHAMATKASAAAGQEFTASLQKLTAAKKAARTAISDATKSQQAFTASSAASSQGIQVLDSRLGKGKEALALFGGALNVISPQAGMVVMQVSALGGALKGMTSLLGLAGAGVGSLLGLLGPLVLAIGAVIGTIVYYRNEQRLLNEMLREHAALSGATTDALKKYKENFDEITRSLSEATGATDTYAATSAAKTRTLEANSKTVRDALQKQLQAELDLIEKGKWDATYNNEQMAAAMKRRDAIQAQIKTMEELDAVAKTRIAQEEEYRRAADAATAAELAKAAATKGTASAARDASAALKAYNEEWKLSSFFKEFEAQAEKANDAWALTDEQLKVMVAEFSKLDDVARKTAYDMQAGTISSGLEKASSVLSAGVSGLLAALGPQGAVLAGIYGLATRGSDMIQGLADEISGIPAQLAAMPDAVVNLSIALSDMGPQIAEALTRAVTNPKVWIAVNRAMIEMIVLWPKTIIMGIWEGLKWLFGGGLWSQASKDFVRGVWDGVWSWAQRLVDGFKSLFSWDGIKKAGSGAWDTVKEIGTIGKAETTTYGDTPGLMRATGTNVRFLPGDYFAAARTPTGVAQQAAVAMGRPSQSGGGNTIILNVPVGAIITPDGARVLVREIARFVGNDLSPATGLAL